MAKLNIDLYDVSGMELDEQRKFNHIDCPAGMDTKQRLYIKRVENGHVFYCHHCSSSGFVLSKYARFKEATKRRKCAVEEPKALQGKLRKTLQLPDHCTRDIREWPREARGWVRQYGITREEIRDYGLLYDIDSRRVVLPWYSGSDLGLYQLRKIFADDAGTDGTKPKYITRRRSLAGAHNISGDSSTRVLVLCEDILSAIKLSRVCAVYPLLGTSLSTEGLTTIMDGDWDRIYIWLDDDNRYVKKAQLVLKITLENFFKVKIVHTKGKDPKEHTIEEIKEILDL